MNSKHYTIFSEDLTLNTDNTFTLPIMSINNVKSFQINKISIPQSYNTISAARGNNTFRVESTTVTVADGTYGIADLCSALQTLLVAVDATFTVSYNLNLKSVTIARTGNFTITLSSSGLAKNLGFATTGSLTGAATYTSTKAFNPYDLGVINFHADQLKYYCESATSKNKTNFICAIPIKTSPDDYITYEPEYPIAFRFQNGNITISNMLLYFTFREGTVINFNGVPWAMELEFVSDY